MNEWFPMQVRCIHCHEPTEVIDESDFSRLSCASCGGTFSLVGERTVTYDRSGVQTLGHFELIEQVGSGGFGSVWKARDTELDRTVAIKIPRKGQLGAEEAEQFLREARAAAQLKHPNIVSVHEVGRHDETVYIVSDFVQGATLESWLTGQQLSAREAAELCAKIADALHHAHEAGVIHRDIKPGNVMLDLDGEPHLMDFGLARRQTGEVTMTVEGRILGTPAYMSPEQARGEGHRADRRTDIYSLGVILFRILTGELPFRGNPEMLIVQILREDAPSPRKLSSQVPRDLETICLKCLEKEAAKRYQTAAEASDDLRRFLAGEPIQARPVKQIERAWRWCKRNPAVAALSAVVAVALLAVTGVLWMLWVGEASNATRLAQEQQRTQTVLDDSQKLSAELALDKGQLLGEQGDANAALLWMARGLKLAPPEADDLRRVIRTNLGAWRSRVSPLRFILANKGLTEAAAFTPDGKILVTASGPDRGKYHQEDYKGVSVRRWDAITGKPLGDPVHYPDMPNGGLVASHIVLGSDARRILIGYRNGAARLMDLVTNKVLWESSGKGVVTCAALSRDGKTVLIARSESKKKKWWQGQAGLVQLYDVDKSKTLLRQPVKHERPVIAAAFAPDGETFVTASGVWGGVTSIPRE